LRVASCQNQVITWSQDAFHPEHDNLWQRLATGSMSIGRWANDTGQWSIARGQLTMTN
jgi:hypothetical protein